MSVSYQRRNNPLKWIQGFYSRTYSHPLDGGNQGKIGSIAPIHRVRFQSIVPRYRLSISDATDTLIGLIFSESTVPRGSMVFPIAEVNRADRIVPKKLSQGNKPVRGVERKTASRNTTRLVRIGEFEVVNDIGFEPPTFVDQNA